MDDLAAKLQSILSSPEGQEQLKNIQSMLGMSDGQQKSSEEANNSSSGELDLSGLLNALGGNGGQNAAPASEQSRNGQGGVDLSSLLGMLGNSNAGQTSSPSSDGTASSEDAVLPNIDVGMILKLQQIFQNMKVNDKNSQLLLALKPHFGQARQAKVDQAISMMRLFSMLPMLKESGIFAGL